jgi:hypothetical protein
MTPKIAIVGSKSLEGMDSVYEIIDNIIVNEEANLGEFILINGGEDGVDTMAGEIALAHGLEYEVVPLRECVQGCNPAKPYCFAHSYEPRSKEIADEALIIYRVYDESCGTSTCEITARKGDELGRRVVRIPVDVPTITAN